ncbi:M23 family metallopeptidase [Ramlibacter albus]|nr:M23 family metallopeptidase [Ramlibacter albus]
MKAHLALLAFAAACIAASDPEGERLLSQRTLSMPVLGVAPTSLHDMFNDKRGGSRPHEAIDIMAPRGTPVLAVDDGQVAKLFLSKPGGMTVYHFDPTGRLAYYYAHLNQYAPGLKEGMPLKRGQLLGYVGTSGNADPGAPHLHFGVFKLGPQKQWWKGDPVNPYPALRNAAVVTALR